MSFEGRLDDGHVDACGPFSKWKKKKVKYCNYGVLNMSDEVHLEIGGFYLTDLTQVNEFRIVAGMKI